ncbi:MAG: hypothetical protein MJZ65_03680 [Paludibacteraceae bacterium]|nr:hypothetical protein [Paludibacteraceae bacterium]
MIKKHFLVLALCAAMTSVVAAPVLLTGSSAMVEDISVDKPNYFITITAATADGKQFNLLFDVWPASASAFGTFSTADKSLLYFNSAVERASDKEQFYCVESNNNLLTLAYNGDGTTTISGQLEVENYPDEGTTVYQVSAFSFEYSEKDVPPTPPEDPYRFEPAKDTAVTFVADVVNFRQRTDYVEITLNEMADETYHWIELRLLSDTLDWAAGTYAINNSGEKGSLTASQGYLGPQNDDPCYVAIRFDDEYSWGQYTPYYLISGSLSVSYNEKGDSIFVQGQATSKNGSVFTVIANSYNMLYQKEEEPREPEYVELAIDTVMITYVPNKSDSLANEFYYTFNFFGSQDADGYPNVIVDAILSKPMEMVEGEYSLKDGLSNLILFQNQADFNTWFFGGDYYIFTSANLSLTPAAGTKWNYSMFITDTIGSEYWFTFDQDPHVLLPKEEEDVDPAEQPFYDELHERQYDLTMEFDSLIWVDNRTPDDPIIDMYLLQQTPDIDGLIYYVQLGFYSQDEVVPAGTYPLSSDEEAYNIFSSSLGRYGNIVIPCYAAIMDMNGWAHAIWYLTEGEITLQYDENGQPTFSGVCTSYYGSTIRFYYHADKEDTALPHSVASSKARKYLKNGKLWIEQGHRTYDVLGQIR